MGSPEAIELMYAPDEQIMGFRAADPDVEHAYPIRAMGKSGTTYLVSGRAFTQYFNINTDVARRYTAYLEGDALCIDLRGPSTDVTGNRRPNGQQAESYEGTP